jgi:hypothetical protein
MKNRVRKLIAELIWGTRAAEIAEAAAVLPLMFMILLGIFWFGQAFSIYGAITRAAQDGARAGSMAYCATCVGTNTLAAYATNAVNAVNADLQASQLNPNLASFNPAQVPNLLNCTSGAVQACATPGSGGSGNICVQSPVQLTISTSGTSGVCGVAVTFQYPFQFWLPFTSVNNQKIWITASSQVRLETR